MPQQIPTVYENTFSFQYASSDTRNSQELIDDFNLVQSISGDAYQVRFQHNDEDWFYAVNHVDYDNDFRADLGFIGHVGFKKSVIGVQRTWRSSDQNNWWNRMNVYSDWDITHDQYGRLLEKEFQINYRINAIKQSFFGFNAETRQRLWNDILFNENRFGIDASFVPIAGWEIGAGSSFGDAVDFSNSKIAKRTGAYIFVNANLGKHFSLDFTHSFRKLNRDGGDVFVANQSDLRFSYQFNIRQRLRLAIINTSINRDTSLYSFEIDSHNRHLSNQLIYSYKVNPKTLIFIGYSDAGGENQNIDLTTTNRTFFMKFSYAWKR